MITAVILTKNEEENLERCLASVRWCAEMVVIDSGSSDGTAARALQLGARVLVNLPLGPFRISEQRNWALDHGRITTPWVIFLDADEVIPPALQMVLQTTCVVENLEFTAYEMTPRYLFWGRWLKRTQGFPNWHSRVVRVGETRFGGGVWEHFAPGAKIGFISEPYDHFANSKGLSDWLARHDRYSSWDAQKIIDYLDTGDASALGTNRKSRLRLWAARYYFLRPFVRFGHMYFVRLGFIEGFSALVFCSLYFFYEWMTVLKVIELRRIRAGKPL